LALAETPLRYLQEPLTYFVPRFSFSPGNDRLATPWRASSSFFDPMYHMYRFLTHKDIDLNRALLRYVETKVIRNDPSPDVTLIKEVHGLLAVNSVIARLDCPAVLVTRSPLRVINSLLSYQKLPTPIWRNEQKYLQAAQVLSDFFPGREAVIRRYLARFVDDGVRRRETVVGKALTVAIISNILMQRAKVDARILHVDYDDLCLNPLDRFAACAKHLSLSFGTSLEGKIASTSAVQGGDGHPTRAFQKISALQLSKELTAISPDEVDEIDTVLQDCGLAEADV
jgi:hypothetical protein